MADNTINVKLRQRIDTENNWAVKNPVLLNGEMAVSSDKDGRYKIGNGTSKWSDLSYAKARLEKSDVTGALGYTPPTTNTTYSDVTQSTHGLMTAADKKKLDGIASGAQVGTVTGIKMNGVSKGTSGVVDLGTVITSHQSLSNYVQKRENGYSYNNLASAYSPTTPTYLRITVPKASSTWTMCMLEISLKANYANGTFGKILFHGNWASNAEWNTLRADVSRLLGTEIKMYASDKQYIYISGIKGYYTCTVDKMLIGDNATGQDLSGVKIDAVTKLPSTYQTVEMTYGAATATADKSGLMSNSDKSKLDGITAGANKYTHPSYTAKTSGLYKVTVDSTGHVSATTAVTKADITGLGIPGADTNTWRGIQNNLTSDSTTDSLSAAQGKALKTLVDGKAPSSHTHTKSQIADFPSSLPANGGTSNYTNYINVHAIPASENLNSYTNSGYYYCNANATVQTMKNCPTTNAFFMIVGQHAGIYQELTEYMIDSPKKYMRNYYSGTWGSWYRIYTEVDKPKKSDIGLGNVNNTADTDKSVKYATSAGSATTATALTTSAGSATQPVYFSGGKPVATTYTLGKSVPSNAVFTDTTYSTFVKSGSGAKAGLVPAPSTTAGTTKYLREDGTWVTPPNTNTTNTTGSTNTSSKIYLVGATSQATAPQTYSHDTVYVGTDGCLYSNSKKVLNEDNWGTDITAADINAMFA